MSLLFFLMAFVNTIIDSLKDSLVITATGGGTEVIPYLTVYAVLPSSLLFLVAYSWGTQRFRCGGLGVGWGATARAVGALRELGGSAMPATRLETQAVTRHPTTRPCPHPLACYPCAAARSCSTSSSPSS